MTFWQCAIGCGLISMAFMAIVAACMLSSQLTESEEDNPAGLRRANRIDGQRKWDARLGRYE